MSTIKQCDRCKRLYEKCHNIRLWVTDTPCISVGIKDLCNDCQSELEKWYFKESEE